MVFVQLTITEFKLRRSCFLLADHLKSQGSVRTLQFILFLYIQQIHKISFKASLVSGGEEYPAYI